MSTLGDCWQGECDEDQSHKDPSHRAGGIGASHAIPARPLGQEEYIVVFRFHYQNKRG